MEGRLRPALLLATAILVSGCFGNLSGTVTEDGLGLEGVTVVLSGKAYMVTVTGAGGTFLFENLKGGTYTVTMEPPPGYTRSVAREVEKEYFVDVTGVDFAIETATERQTTSGTVVWPPLM